uniref:Uncharacterized protein n=1 Tax=Kalanchoe fedtschenkoi TaxID=63787 RepID=A0A7N0SXQ7_KALFE
MGRWLGWIDIYDEDASFTVHQLVWHLRGATLQEDYAEVEKLLVKREERIRAEMAEEVERLKRGGWMKEEMEKVMREAAAAEIGKMRKLVGDESVKKAENKCEELRGENSKLRDALEMVEKLKREMEEAGNQTVRRLERLRKKAEHELQISGSKLKKMEMRVSTMRKDFLLLKSFNGGVKSGPEAGCGVRNPVTVLSDEFGGGSGVPSVKMAAKKMMEVVSPVSPKSDANIKPSDAQGSGMKDKCIDKEKQMIKDAIQVTSSDDEDDPSKLQSKSKDKSDSSPVKLECGSQPPVGSDRDTSKLLSGLKRKRLSFFIDGDKSETVPHPSTDNGVSPNLLTQGGESNESLTVSAGDGDTKWVLSGLAKEKGGNGGSIFDKVEKCLVAMGFDVSEDGSSSDMEDGF